jgi:predicted phage terminase large subunit-like protein
MLDAPTIKGFVGSLLVKQFDKPVPIPKIHEEWWELCCTDDKFIAIAAPRRHAKSTAITLSYVLASVLFRQSSFVVIVSDTEAQANLFLGDIKQQLIENQDLVTLFGIKKFIKLAETDIIVEMEDGYQFRIITKGAEQKLRGLKWRNKRPDLIVCDDLENEEIVASQERREKFRRWFNAALIPCKSPAGKIIIVGTILHMDSLLERLMPDTLKSTTVVEDLKQWSTVKKGLWRSVKYRAHNEDFSKILWPEGWSKEALKEIRQGFIDQGLPDVYSQEYLNYPIDESSAYFKRDDFLPLTLNDIEEVEEKRVHYYSAVDFAVSQKENSDYTVIATVAVTSTGELLVIDIRRGRWDSAEIVEQMFSVQKRYKPELFVVEQGAIQKAIGPFLNREMMVRNIYMNLYPMVPTKDKMSRARSIQARMRAGGIRFDKERFWYDTLEDEMARFPKDRHDDQVDALSWIGLALDKIVDAPTQEELEDEEYNHMVSEYNMYSGRSTITGY